MRLGNRRLASRFEVVGKPWASVETFETLRVRNLAREGMLVESETPLAVGSVHEFQLVSGTVMAHVRAAVRHLSSARQAGSERWYLVGLEFLGLDAQTAARIKRILREQPAQAIPRGPEAEHEFTKPRRSPRVATTIGTVAIRPVSLPVRLLDLSSGGLLLACPDPTRIGAAPRVIAGLAGRRLDVEVDIRHVSSQWDEEARGYLVGGSFPSLDPLARRTLNDLLGASDPHTAGEPPPRVDRDRARTPARGEIRPELPVRRRERPRPEPSSSMTPAT